MRLFAGVIEITDSANVKSHDYLKSNMPHFQNQEGSYHERQCRYPLSRTGSYLRHLRAPAAFARQPSVDKLSNKQLISLIATAKTPAEHLRLAEYYSAKAKAYDAESKMHAEWAEAYKKNPASTPGKFSTESESHCDFFSTSFKNMAAKMQELAQMH